LSFAWRSVNARQRTQRAAGFVDLDAALVDGNLCFHEPAYYAKRDAGVGRRHRPRYRLACECQEINRVAAAWRWHSMKLKPLGDRLIVRAVEEEETTASGIVLPDTAKEKPQKGEVLAVGDGKVSEETGKRIPLDVAEGDEVLYSKYGGTEITVEGEDLLVLRESDVLAKVL
jgi:chaperonin GroES